MGSPDTSLGIRVDDLFLDDEGRVTISDPELERMVGNMVVTNLEPAGEPTTNNCHGGNCAKGCGSKIEEEVLPE